MGIILDTWCWFCFSGPDAEIYLQGQISQDIRQLRNHPFIYAGLLSNKGRVISDLRIFINEGKYYVSGHCSRKREIAQRFRLYLVADDVEITELQTQKAIFYKKDSSGEIPDRGRVTFDFELYGMLGKIVLFNEEEIGLRTEKMISVSQLKFQRILSFTPEWGYEITEKTLLQELSDDERWFSLKKGCYVGQEIVARTHSRGHVTKRLFLFAVSAGCKEGDELFFEGNKAGILTSVASKESTGEVLALGYLQRNFWDCSFFTTQKGETALVQQRGFSTSSV